MKQKTKLRRMLSLLFVAICASTVAFGVGVSAWSLMTSSQNQWADNESVATNTTSYAAPAKAPAATRTFDGLAENTVAVIPDGNSYTEYTDLAEAFYDASAGQTVVLVKDLDISVTQGADQFCAEIPNSITFDGNGNTLTVNRRGISVAPQSNNVKGKFLAPAAVSTYGFNVTIQNVTIQNTASQSRGYGGRCITTRGKLGSLTLDNVILTTDGSNYNNTISPIFIGGSQATAATINVTNSSIITDADAAKGDAITTINPIVLNITGSTLTAANVINFGEADESVGSNGSTVNVAGSTLTASVAAFHFYDSNIAVDLASSTVTGAVAEFESTSGNAVAIAGGQFSQVVDDALLAEGYICHKVATNGLYLVEEGAYSCYIDEVGYPTLAEAIACTPSNTETTITMQADEAIVAGLAIAADKIVVLELNGHTISGNTDSNATYALITNKGTLTIQDNTDTNLDGTGTGLITTYITNADQNDVPGYASNTITNNGNLTVKSGKIVNNGNGYACYAIDNVSNGTLYTPMLKIEGGRMEQMNEYTYAVRMFCNSTTNTNSVEVTGGVITGGYGLWLQTPNANSNHASLAISGGTIESRDGAAVYIGGTKGHREDISVEITGGTITGQENSVIVQGVNNADYVFRNLTVSGGEFTGIAAGANISDVVSGGTFSNPVPYALCADGFVCSDTPNEQGKYVVSEGSYVAMVGSYGYADFSNAVSAAAAVEEGTTITLLQNITLSEDASLAFGANTVEAGGEYGITVASGSNVTISGGSFDVPVVDSGTLVLTGDADLNEGLTVNGTLTADAAFTGTVSSLTVNNGATVAISGGTFATDVIGYCPDGYITAKNEDNTYSVHAGYYHAKIGDDTYEFLQDALDDVAKNYDTPTEITINIIRDIEEETVTVGEFNNFKVTIDGTKAGDEGNYKFYGQFNLDGKRVSGGSVEKGASITLQNIDFVQRYQKDAITSPSNSYTHHVTIQNCTYEGNAEWANTWFINMLDVAYYFNVNNITATNTRLISGKGYNKSSAEGYGLVVENVIATEGITAVFNNVKTNCEILIQNNTISATKYVLRDAPEAYEGTITLKDNNFTTTTTEDDEGVFYTRRPADTKPHILVESGSYVGRVAQKTANHVVAISGGHFNVDLTDAACADFIADEYVAINDGTEDVPYTVKRGTCKRVVNEANVYYLTVDDAVTAASEGDVITLLTSVAEEGVFACETMTIAAGDKNVTLDLNGLTLQPNALQINSGTLTIANGIVEGGVVANGGTLAFDNTCGTNDITVTGESSLNLATGSFANDIPEQYLAEHYATNLIDEVYVVKATIQIASIEDLQALATLVNTPNGAATKNNTYELTADLDLTGVTWTPIGNLAAYPGRSFQGTFDGKGHTISNLTCIDNTVNYATAALFGSAKNAIIKNLTLSDVDIQSTHYAAAFVAYTSEGSNTIENCHVVGGSIVSTPELIGGSYDNGDKVGGIVGYTTNFNIINCSVEDVEIQAYRDLGGLAGYITNGTVTGNTLKDVTLTQDNTNGYKTNGDGSLQDMSTTVGLVVGGRSAASIKTQANDVAQNITENVVITAPVVIAKIGEVSYATLAAAVAAAEENDVVEICKADTYTMPNLPQNITVKGAVAGVVFNCEGTSNIASVPNGATFENLTMNFGTNNYHGFQHAGTINMKDCTLNGKLFSYADMNFDGCTFNAPGTTESGYSSKDYSMWVYAGNVTYTNCTFNCNGKCVNVYNEQGTILYGVTATGCTFNSEEANKAAFNVKATCGTKPLAFEVVVEDCEATGSWPAASTSESLVVLNSLVQVDDINPAVASVTDIAEITTNETTGEKEETVLYTTRVAEYAGNRYDTLQEAIDAAEDGKNNVINMLKDVTLNISLTVDKGVTIDGQGYSITSSAAQAALLSGSGDITFENVNITASAGHGIQVGNDNVTYTGQLTLTNSTLTVAKRGIRVYNENAGFGIAVENSTIQSNLADPTTAYTTGNDAIALSLGGSNNNGYTVNVTNSELKGFSYVLNSTSSGSNLTVTMTGGKTYGRAAVNVWGSNSTFTLDGVEVHGLNNETGPTEAFACIVENVGATNNTYNINGCEFVATLSEAAMNASGSNATEQMVDLRGTASTMNITGETTYTCNSEERGGLLFDEGALQNNTVALDATAKASLAEELDKLDITIVSDEPDENGMYPLAFQGVAQLMYLDNGAWGDGGYFTTIESVFSDANFGDNSYVTLLADAELQNDIVLNCDYFLLDQNGHTITTNGHGIVLATGKFVYCKNEAANLFTTEDARADIVKYDGSGWNIYAAEHHEVAYTIDGETDYYYFEEVFDEGSPEEGATVTLQKDITLVQSVSATNSFTLNFDGNTLSRGGYTITLANDVTVTTDEQVADYAALFVPADPTYMVVEAENDGNYTYTAVTKESKGIFELADADGSYNRNADVQAEKVSYTRSYDEDRVGKYQPWLLPFNYAITDEDAAQFTFYKINMIANAPEDGVAEESDKIWIFITPMKVDDVLYANKPYLYVPMSAVDNYQFVSENVTLKAKKDGALISTETMLNRYSFYGTYGPTTLNDENFAFYMGTNSKLSYPEGEDITVGVFRWILRVESKEDDGYVREIEFAEGCDATGIRFVEDGTEGETYYTLDGKKIQKPGRGIYVKKTADGEVKKVYIK